MATSPRSPHSNEALVSETTKSAPSDDMVIWYDQWHFYFASSSLPKNLIIFVLCPFICCSPFFLWRSWYMGLVEGTCLIVAETHYTEVLSGTLPHRVPVVPMW